MSPTLRLLRPRVDPSLARAGAQIRAMVNQGCEIRRHRLALKQMAELKLELTDLKAILRNWTVRNREAVGSFEPETYVGTGCAIEQLEEKRITKEFAIMVAVEEPTRPGRLGVLNIWRLGER
jgi:hypothetical protein